MRTVWIGALLLAACAPEGESASRATLPLLNGRASGDEENASVLIETTRDSGTASCSGRIIAPGLAVTARHCLITLDAERAVACDHDGDPLDVTYTADLRPEPPERIHVHVGSQRSALRAVGVRQVLAPNDVTICRSDIAFLVLKEPGLELRTPLRRAPVRIAEELSVTGWGLTGDARDPPPERWTIDRLRVSDVGPGFIPAGAFATPGDSLCTGDSGAVALIGGAVVGIYSRIEGKVCSFEYARNIFTATAAEHDLAVRAYAAIGEEPWYVGERPPWLAPEGAACAGDVDCRSARCDAASKTCAAACGETGLACAADRTCAAGACVVVDDAGGTIERARPPEAPASRSCKAAPHHPDGRCPYLLAGAALGVSVWRRRSGRRDAA